jgi:hypothetical protein
MQYKDIEFSSLWSRDLSTAPGSTIHRGEGTENPKSRALTCEGVRVSLVIRNLGREEHDPEEDCKRSRCGNYILNLAVCEDHSLTGTKLLRSNTYKSAHEHGDTVQMLIRRI